MPARITNGRPLLPYTSSRKSKSSSSSSSRRQLSRKLSHIRSARQKRLLGALAIASEELPDQDARPSHRRGDMYGIQQEEGEDLNQDRKERKPLPHPKNQAPLPPLQKRDGSTKNTVRSSNDGPSKPKKRRFARPVTPNEPTDPCSDNFPTHRDGHDLGDSSSDNSDTDQEDGSSNESELSSNNDSVLHSEPDSPGDITVPSELPSDPEFEPGFHSSDDEEIDSDEFESDSEGRNMDKNRITELHQIIDVLHPQQPSDSTSRQSHSLDSFPSEGIPASQKLQILDLIPTIRDPRMRQALETAFINHKSSGLKGAKTLSAPMPPLELARLNRIATSKEAHKLLTRWLETVKQHRRAQHIQFPLPDPHHTGAQGESQFLPLPSTEHHLDDLSAFVEEMLHKTEARDRSVASSTPREGPHKVASGFLAVEDPEEKPEDQEQKSSAEILAARIQLRKRREKMYREELRAKRIKKIKSRTHRKINRKQRQKALNIELQAKIAAGIEISTEESETLQRKRAEARMSDKHRNTKWLKEMKVSGRSVWDSEAREGIRDLANIAADMLSKDGEAILPDYSRLEGLQASNQTINGVTAFGPDGLVKSTSFGASGPDEGLRTSRKASSLGNPKEEREQSLSDSEGSQDDGDAQNPWIEPDPQPPRSLAQEELPSSKTRGRTGIVKSRHEDNDAADRHDEKSVIGVDSQSINGMGDQGGGEGADSQLITLDASDIEDSSEDEQAPGNVGTKSNGSLRRSNKGKDKDEELLRRLGRNHEYVQEAFAGTDLVAEFEREKRETVAEQADQVEDLTLPGWGHWTGAGVSKRDKAMSKGRVTRIKPGVKPEKRRDARLKDVIINEKKVRGNLKYSADRVPHPFTSRVEYERSIRMPIGPEWVSEQPKPRVLVKPGEVILPIEVPLV